MWVSVHLVAGLALGAALHLPLWLLLPLAVVLHVVMDVIPHWDYAFKRGKEYWGIADVATSVLILGVCGFGLGYPAAVLLTGVVSAAPDLDVLNALVPRERRVRWFPSHWAGFPHGQAGKGLGLATQAAVVALSIGMLAVTQPGG